MHPARLARLGEKSSMRRGHEYQDASAERERSRASECQGHDARSGTVQRECPCSLPPLTRFPALALHATRCYRDAVDAVMGRVTRGTSDDHRWRAARAAITACCEQPAKQCMRTRSPLPDGERRRTVIVRRTSRHPVAAFPSGTEFARYVISSRGVGVHRHLQCVRWRTRP